MFDWLSRSFVAALLLFTVACDKGGDGPAAGPSQERTRKPVDAAPALEALQESRFAEAEQLAAGFLRDDHLDPLANGVAALTLFKRTMHDVVLDGIALFGAFVFMGSINYRYAAWSLKDTEQRLAEVADHLQKAAADPAFAMDLCLACWRNDWNKDGRIDERDSRILEIELDANGDWMEENDPRRRPTFRFDVGDLHWALAFVSFQRAALSVVAAYDYTELGAVFARFFRRTDVTKATIKLVDKQRIHAARDLVLAGLDHADAARRAYLVEKDDEGEWVPNPSQKNHPLPLPVDAALFETWETVLRDVKALVAGEEGLDVRAAAQLGDHQWQDPPGGYLNIGRLFEEPGDLTFDRTNIRVFERERTRADAEAVLRDIFGDKYVPQMKASPLTGIAARVAGEIEKGEESFERKLRYLLWLN